MELRLRNMIFISRTTPLGRTPIPSTVLLIWIAFSLLALPRSVLSTESESEIIRPKEEFVGSTHVDTLSVSDRGYRNLVIAIREDLPEDAFPMLIDELKKSFTGASEFMYRATRSLAYFKSIRILIPATWLNTSDVSTATWERYETSDVRIAPANENFPYTEKFTGCGLPGEYIGLTPDYIVNRKDGVNALHDIYGTPNKVIVHEWGHYRWGLFDEYPRYAPFYRDAETGQIEATRCVLSIPGEIRNRFTGQPCGEADLNNDGLPDSTKCTFFDDMKSTAYSASIMYKQYMSNNEQFCDDPARPGVPGTVAHNPMAPNEQNTKCNQRSSWEVLRAHPDFAGTESLDPKPIDSTVPEFVIVRQKPQTTTVMVLDTSGSMEGERLVLLQQAAANIIENVLPLGSRLGIVRFDEYAHVLHHIVEIDSTDARDSLVSSLPKEVNGRTSIGRGVQLAVQELKKSEKDPSGSTLIVITDGEENSHPYITDVIGEVANLTVNTVAVGAEADQSLELLAEHTGGDSFSHTDRSSEIYLSFFKAAAAQMAASQVTSAVIDADFTSIPVFETFTNKFYLEDALTGGLKITIAYIWTTRSRSITFELTKPNQEVVDSFSRLYTTDERYKQIKINLDQDQVMAGEWTLNVTNEGISEDDFSIVIQPRVKPGAMPILAKAHWAVPKITPPSRQILYVFVQQGDTPVINAKVNAVVRLNSGSDAADTVTLVPRDDGLGADINKNDGIYSAYFTNFLGHGRHGVEVHVRNGEETTLLKGGVVGYGAATNPNFPGPDRTVILEATGEFQREITGGSFECTSVSVCGNKSVDVYPPGQITDLTADLGSGDLATLTFTAPGDDLTDGNATRYEVRYSSSFTKISKNFSSCEMVPSHWFVAGDVTMPSGAGKLEQFVINFSNSSSTSSDPGHTPLTVAIIAIDDVGNRGDRSNLVTLTRVPTASQSRAAWPPGMIAGVLLSIIILLLIIIVIVVIVYLKRGKAPTKYHYTAPHCNGSLGV
ncbi:calcium-activated chloride channel regulator 3A-1-like [Diadema antillarum]|uniref:calcium-activated chloride channel regulator 3A-1-like n=1 Tax=Diadema antillarum TaxID=105358 RepID=UPI003A88BF1B